MERLNFKSGGNFRLVLVKSSFQAPNVSPISRRRVIGAEKIIGSRQPFVEVLLYDCNRDLSCSEDTREAGMAGEHVEEFFLEHCRHALGQRGKGGMAKPC